VSAPAYQLIGQQFGGVGGYGEYYGGPYGGTSYPLLTVPILYVGSHDLGKRTRTLKVGPEHSRHGLVIGQRTWAEVGLWHVVHRNLTEAEGLALRPYFEAGEFYLIPNGNPQSLVRTVRWVTREFDLKQSRGSLYYIEYDLQEKP